MDDTHAQALLDLLNLYVTTYGGPGTNEINPHTLTLAELHEDLTRSLDRTGGEFKP